jgi:hypothetical protein
LQYYTGTHYGIVALCTSLYNVQSFEPPARHGWEVEGIEAHAEERWAIEVCRSIDAQMVEALQSLFSLFRVLDMLTTYAIQRMKFIGVSGRRPCLDGARGVLTGCRIHFKDVQEY